MIDLKRTIVYAACILGAFLLQSSLFSLLALADIVPNLLIIVTVSIALIRGRSEGCAVGFFSGLLMDIAFGSFLGFYALCYMVIGYLLGYFNQIYYEEDITLPLMLIGLADLFYGMIMFIFRFMPRGRFNILFYLRRIILPEIVYRVIVSIILYRFMLFICKKLDKKGSEDFIV